MKRLITAISLVAAMAGSAGATATAYDQFLFNGVVTTTQSYVIPMGNGGGGNIDLLSASLTASSVTTTAQTFTDGTQSTGSITVVSTAALPATSGSDTLTVTTNSALSPTQGSDSILVTTAASAISGSSLTVVTMQSYTFQVGVAISSTIATTTGTAVNIASVINATVQNVTATVSGSSVIVTCNSNGSFCNSYQMSATSATAFSVATAKFTGGNDNASFNLNGHTFYQGSDWFQMAQASNTAVSILNSITPLGAFTASTNTTTSVQIKCVTAGSFCNADTLTTSTGALTAATAKFAGGQGNAFFIIDGQVLAQGTQWTVGSSTAQAASSIASAMIANATLSSLLVTTAPAVCGLSNACGVVTVTGVIQTTSNNYSWSSSTQSALSVTNAGLFGGTTAGYTIQEGNEIVLPSHGLTTGMGLLYTSGTVTVAPLVNQTTYYAIAVDANDIELATTQAGAIAGTFITLTSSSTSGPHTFTLAPIGLTGAVTATWQASNDGVNYGNLSVTTVNFGSPYTPSTTIWDMGQNDFKFVRINIAGPSFGGANVAVRVFGKRYGLGL